MDAAWTANIVRGIVLSLIILIIAPWVGVFYESTSLPGLLRFVALGVFLRGFANIGRMYFFKNMRFDRLFLEQVGKSAVNLLILIPLAFVLRSV